MPAAPIDRRDFLRHAAMLGAALPMAGLALPARAEAAALVARRVFFDNPDCTNVRVSPDGKNLAYVAPVNGVNNLWVAPVSRSGRGAARYPRHRPQHRQLFPLGVQQPSSGLLQGARRRRELARGRASTSPAARSFR